MKSFRGILRPPLLAAAQPLKALPLASLLPRQALMAATGYAWDRKRVSWNFTSCGGKKGGRRLLAHK